MKSRTIQLTAEPARDAVDTAIRIPLTRRELLKGTGVLFGSLALSSPLALFAPSRAWALEMKKLDAHQGEVLLAFAKRVFPHATLDDAVYALVVKALDGKAADNAAMQTQLAEGVGKLDGLAGGDWTKRAITEQDRDTATLAGSPFFETVRSTSVVALYANPLAYAHFGYGAEKGDGGYLHQGFNNLSWLPDPPANDSGPIPKD